MTVSDVTQATLPNGEVANPKTIAAKVTGMFTEMMLKTMEESIQAEDGLFGNSSSSEIYRGMLREQMAAAVSKQLQSPFERQLEQGIHNQMPKGAAPAEESTSPVPSMPTSSPSPSVDSNGDMPVKGRVSSPVGWRKDPIAGDMRFHKGTDIAAPYGTDVKSVADGVVVESGPKGTYGNVVVVELGDGRKMLYGHNSANLVQVGDRVQQGDVIAQVGATGRATGPHVHFEIIETETKISLKSGNGSSDNNSGKDFHQPTKDGPGALNE